MHYRTGVAVLVLLAVGACSGDRALQPPAKTIVHATVWWLDKAGARHETQLPDQAVNQIFVRRNPGKPPGPALTAPVTTSHQVTDSTGQVWTATITAIPGQPQTATTLSTGDTAVYSQQMTWTATDTGWALSQMTMTVSTPTVSGGGSGRVQPPPEETMIRSRLAPLLAMGRRCTTAAAAFLLPEPAEAGIWCYIGSILGMIAADINFARSLATALVDPVGVLEAFTFVMSAEAWFLSCAES